MKTWMEKLNKRKFLLPDCLSWHIGVFLSLDSKTETSALQGSQACWLSEWNSLRQFSWFSGHQTVTGILQSALLSLKLADYRSWDFLASNNYVSIKQFLLKINKWINICTYYKYIYDLYAFMYIYHIYILRYTIYIKIYIFYWFCLGEI